MKSSIAHSSLLVVKASLFMRFFPLVLVFLTLHYASAASLRLPSLPPSAFADGEATTTKSLGNPYFTTNYFKVVLSLNCTPTNNIQIAFGNDTMPQDGVLAAEETLFIIGWDSGNWIIYPPGLRQPLIATPPNPRSARRRTLTLASRLDSSGKPVTLQIIDDSGTPLFASITASPPLWLAPGGWSTIRAVRRGAAIADENITINVGSDGSVIILQ